MTGRLFMTSRGEAAVSGAKSLRCGRRLRARGLGRQLIETFMVISGAIALLSVFRPIHHPRAVFWTLTGALTFFYGLRWEMGTDWPSYLASFQQADFVRRLGFEPGFVYYTSVI